MKDWILIGLIFIAIFAIQILTCYWAFLFHWSVGVFAICFWVIIDIISYMKSE